MGRLTKSEYYKEWSQTASGKDSKKQRNRNYYHSTHGRRNHCNSQLLYKYGIGIADKEEMYQKQNGKCALCPANLPGLYRSHVDHDHVTGKVRGLLCMRCNIFIAYLEERKNRLNTVFDYLGWKD